MVGTSEVIETIIAVEKLRERAATEAAESKEKSTNTYNEAAGKLAGIFDQITLESVSAFDSKGKIAVGQLCFSLATVYTTMAKDSSVDTEKISLLEKAQAIMEGPIFELSFEEMKATNLSITDNPVLWGSEVWRVKARIFERRPNASAGDIAKAIDCYKRAVEESFLVFKKTYESGDKNLRLGALSAYATASVEMAKLFPPERLEEALLVMGATGGFLMAIYPELPNFDRTETILGWILEFCLTKKINPEHQTYKTAMVAYLLLASKLIQEKDRERVLSRITLAKKLEIEFPAGFEEMLNRAVAESRSISPS